MKKSILSTLAGLFVALVILAGSYAIFAKDHFGIRIHGGSMEPTMSDGNFVIFDRVERPAQDTFVVFGIPDAWKDEWKGRNNPTFIKRIAMVGGDKLTWDGNAWYRNGEQFSAVSSGSCEREPLEATIPEGELFVIGDTTTTQTLDSREAFCRGLHYTVSDNYVKHIGTINRVL